MKIGVLINSIEVFGGIGKIAVEQVKNLRKLGVDASLLVFQDWGNENKYREISDDIPIDRLARRLPETKRINRKIPFFTILNGAHFIYPFTLTPYVRDGEWDLIINHESYLTPLLLQLKKNRNIPFVQSIWDPVAYIVKRVYRSGPLQLINPLLCLLGKYADKNFITKAEHIFLSGKPHYDYVAGHSKKITTLYPSVYPQPEESLSLKPDPYVFTVTAWKKGKNPEYLFEIVENFPNIRIKMGGIWLDTEYQRQFISQVKSRNLENNIDVLGELTEAELKKYYTNARVVLQTNDDRGFGMPALEGAACATSFIIPKNQAVCELFADGVEGFFTVEHDTDKIISLLEKYISSQSFALEKGNLAYKKVRENYSWEQHCRKIIQVAENCTSVPKGNFPASNILSNEIKAEVGV